MSNWISVKDRLPELIDTYPQYKANGDLRACSEPVLVFGRVWHDQFEEHVPVFSVADLRRSWDKEKNDWAVSWNCHNEDLWYDDNLVQYWMPLTVPPLATEQEITPAESLPPKG